MRGVEREPKLRDLVERLGGCVNFDGRKVLYSWIGATRRDWRGQGHFRALTEQSESWAVSLGYHEVVVKTKNRFYDMRAVLAQLGFDVVKLERAAGDVAGVEGVPEQAAPPRPGQRAPQPSHRGPGRPARAHRDARVADGRRTSSSPPRLSSPERRSVPLARYRFCTDCYAVAIRGAGTSPALQTTARPDGKARTAAQEDPVAGPFRREPPGEARAHHRRLRARRLPVDQRGPGRADPPSTCRSRCPRAISSTCRAG